MNTRLVRREVMWAVLGMETALALPLVSITADGNYRLALTVLFALLMPAGYIALRLFDPLRDPAWRVLAGFIAVVILRLPSSLVGGEGAAAAIARFLQAILPAALLFAVWWRGGALAEQEYTAHEVRFEFLLGGGALLVLLVVFHGLVPADPLLLGLTVGLFATSGLLAAAFARQDAADTHKGRLLAGMTAIIPALASLFLMVGVRPGALNSFWSGIARLLELMLLPLSWLMAWLASLLPAPTFTGLPPIPQQPAVDQRNLDSMLNGHEMPDWIAWTALLLVFGLVLFMILGIVRMLLEGGLAARTRYEAEEDVNGVITDATGDPRSDVGKALWWLLSLLRRRPSKPPRHTRAEQQLDARAAYRVLLRWAAEHRLGRQTSETTHQLQQKIASERPDVDAVVDEVTRSYERERYGDTQLTDEQRREIERALQTLAASEPR